MCHEAFPYYAEGWIGVELSYVASLGREQWSSYSRLPYFGSGLDLLFPQRHRPAGSSMFLGNRVGSQCGILSRFRERLILSVYQHFAAICT